MFFRKLPKEIWLDVYEMVNKSHLNLAILLTTELVCLSRLQSDGDAVVAFHFDIFETEVKNLVNPHQAYESDRGYSVDKQTFSGTSPALLRSGCWALVFKDFASTLSLIICIHIPDGVASNGPRAHRLFISSSELVKGVCDPRVQIQRS